MVARFFGVVGNGFIDRSVNGRLILEVCQGSVNFSGVSKNRFGGI